MSSPVRNVTIGDVAACALITMPTPFSFETRLASLEDRDGADFQAHENVKEVKAVCQHRE